MDKASFSPTVLVTGASGFVAMHSILNLLFKGFAVRGTLRSASREAQVRQTLAKYLPEEAELDLVQADLLFNPGWEEAVQDCDFVIHIASPFPLLEPKNEKDVIVPATEGTLRVLRFAAAAGVKRVVLLSSVAAMVYGHEKISKTFDEREWANVDGRIGAYGKSKTLAERSAWNFINSPEIRSKLELTVINAPYLYGPMLDDHYFTSSELIRTLMCHEVPGVARVKVPFADVRDIADIFIAALTAPQAAGRRFCCVGAVCWMQEIALILQRHYASQGYHIPTSQIPDLFIRLLALLDKKVGLTVRALGWDYQLATDQARTILGWQPRPKEETILAMANSLIEFGVL